MTNNALARPQKIEEYENNTLVLKLERHQKDLLELRKKLNSYVCEPKTSLLFERMQTLKFGLEQLRVDNAAIIKNMKYTKKTAVDAMEDIKKQFLAFYTMRKGVEDYIQGVRNC